MSSEEVVFVRRASGLVRELEWYDVAIWALATPAASGMTYYAVKILGDPSAYGGSLPLAFFLAGLVFLPLTVAFAIVASSFPRASSLYVFTSRVLHPVLGYIPFWYFVVGGGAAMASGFLMFIGAKALSGPLCVAAMLTGNKSFLDAASALTNPKVQLAVAVALVAVVWAVHGLGMRVLKWVMRILTVVPLLVTLTVLAYLAALGPGGGVAKWDAIYGPGSAEKILQAAMGKAASSYGVSPLEPVGLFAGTYAMLLWTLWAWTGLEVVTFVGSEVKNPSRSYFLGYLAGYLAVMVLYLANAFLVPRAFGYDFLAAYSYLKSEYPDVLSQLLNGAPAPDPSVPFVASVAVGSAWLAILIGVAYFLWYFNTTVPIWVAGVRGIFSMAFDRALPEKLAEVSQKRAAPTWANHLVALLALLGAAMTYMENMGYSLAAALISFLDFSVFLFVWPVGLALMLAPWWRQELFKRMTVQSKVACSALGAVVFALGWWLMLMTAYPEPLIQAVNIAVGLVGLVAFVASTAKSAARGVDPSKVYGEVPPA